MQSNEFHMSPQQYAEHIANMIHEAQQECRMDIGRVSDLKAQALFETVAEVLGGTMKALHDYCERNEPGWRKDTYMAQSTIRQSPGSSQPPVVSDISVDVDAANPPPRIHDLFPGHST